MSKNRFYDSRLSYLSFVQNTNEKKVISDKIYPYLSKLPHRDVYHFLDAGIGDGTITSNIIKKFHALKPDSLLCITGKEISFEDVFNSLIKMPDRFIEHPKLALTLTNMKFSEIGALASANNHSKVKIKNLVLKGSNAHDFEKQLDKLELFINKNWGFDIDKNGRTAYVKPCIINIFREDQEKLIIGHLPKAKKNNVYDFILASQAYRSRSSTKAKISNVINPLSKILKQDGLLVITHSVGHDSIEKLKTVICFHLKVLNFHHQKNIRIILDKFQVRLLLRCLAQACTQKYLTYFILLNFLKKNLNCCKIMLVKLIKLRKQS